MFNSQIATPNSTQTNSVNKRGVTTLMPPPIEVLAKELGISNLKVEFLAGDGSDRCYFRIQSPELTQSLVLMQLSESDAVKLRNNQYDWISICGILNRHGIFVPKLFKIILESSALIIEDYGDAMFESLIIQAVADRSFDKIQRKYIEASKIIGTLLGIRPSKSDIWSARSFNPEKFVWEMNFFKKYFLEMVCNITLDRGQDQQFQRESLDLANFLSGDSKWFVHRDYHSRNIMVKDDLLALIDFQDARLGPASYDLVSLCFDSYVPLSQEFRRKAFTQGVAEIEALSGPQATEAINTYFRPMLLQRQLKAIGSFGYLTNEKKRGNYLRYVRPALLTLEHDLVFDDRWSFLSEELIGIIGKSCP